METGGTFHSTARPVFDFGPATFERHAEHQHESQTSIVWG